jgi:hypothetical protein
MSGEVVGRGEELSALTAFLGGSADRRAAMVLEREAGIARPATRWLIDTPRTAENDPRTFVV